MTDLMKLLRHGHPLFIFPTHREYLWATTPAKVSKEPCGKFWKNCHKIDRPQKPGVCGISEVAIALG